MTRLFIQYQNNSPVPIFTQNLLVSLTQGELPVVADLIAGYKNAVAPRFDSTPTDELTLHSINNGVETCYNTCDFLTVLGENGTTGFNPLIIRQQEQRQQPATSIPDTQLIWFLLVDNDQHASQYMKYNVSSILSSSLLIPIVDYFRNAVKAMCKNELEFVDAHKLVVYKNKLSFDKRVNGEPPLNSSYLLHHLGETDDEPIIVVKPAQGKAVGTIIGLSIY